MLTAADYVPEGVPRSAMSAQERTEFERLSKAAQHAQVSVVRLRLDALNSATVTVTLPSGKVIQLKGEKRPGTDGFAWIGSDGATFEAELLVSGLHVNGTLTLQGHGQFMLIGGPTFYTLAQLVRPPKP